MLLFLLNKFIQKTYLLSNLIILCSGELNSYLYLAYHYILLK